jgi:hypothetical protein
MLHIDTAPGLAPVMQNPGRRVAGVWTNSASAAAKSSRSAGRASSAAALAPFGCRSGNRRPHPSVDPASGPAQPWLARMLSQHTDLATDCGLGDVQRLGRARTTLTLHSRLEPDPRRWRAGFDQSFWAIPVEWISIQRFDDGNSRSILPTCSVQAQRCHDSP